MLEKSKLVELLKGIRKIRAATIEILVLLKGCLDCLKAVSFRYCIWRWQFISYCSNNMSHRYQNKYWFWNLFF